MAKPKYQPVPEPTNDIDSLLQCIKALKLNLEILTGQVKNTESVDDQFTKISSATGTATARFEEFYNVQTTANTAIAQRTTDLEVEVHNARGAEATLNARITTVNTARANGDIALASDITTLEASYNSISAGGEIRMTVAASPAGYTAAYLVRLLASDGVTTVSTGMQMLLKADGTGSIRFTADQFQLLDPGTGGPKPVFAYSGGTFNFNVPVTVQGEELASRAVTNVEFSRDTGGSPAEVTINTRPGAIVLLDASFDGKPLDGFPVGSVGATLQLQYFNSADVWVDLMEIVLSYMVTGNDESIARYYLHTAFPFRHSPVAGNNRYRVKTSHNEGPVNLRATELYR